MNEDTHMTWTLYVVIALLIGSGVGYWYGIGIGDKQGRSALLAEQEQAKENEKKKVQEEIAQAANPFEADNPLKDSYQNPFKQNTNPFAR